MFRFAVVMAGVMGVAAMAQATDSTVAWSFGVPQTMALGVGSGDGTTAALSNCTTLDPAPNRGAVFYDRITVTNTGTRRAELLARTAVMGGAVGTACPATMDSRLAVYRGAFNPADPRANCVAYNDDSAGGTECSTSAVVSMRPGETVTLVVTASNNGDRFPYDLKFDGSVYSPSIFYAAFEPIELFTGHGLPVSGQFTVDTYPAPLAAGSTLNGGVDPRTGNIQGRLALSPVQLQGIATNLGPVTLRAQMWQDGSGSGALTGGNATYGANDLYFRLQYVTVSGNPVDLGGNCQFGPITWALTGNGDANEIDLMQASFVIPPQSSPANCNGFGAQLSSIVSGSDNSVTISFER